jgi:hypothetical protein
VHQAVEDHERDEGREAAYGEELRRLGEEALPAVTHDYVA